MAASSIQGGRLRRTPLPAGRRPGQDRLTMKLGLFLTLAGDPTQLRDMVATTATLAERTGFHSHWFAKHVALFDTQASRYPYSPDCSFPHTGEVGFAEPFAPVRSADAHTT